MITGPLAGYTIGVSSDGVAEEQITLLSGLGATWLHDPVATVVGRGGSTTGGDRLLRAVVERRVEAVTFTAEAVADGLLAIADDVGVLADVVAALSTDVEVYCVDPDCAVGFEDHPTIRPFVPERHCLVGMVQQIVDHFAGRVQHIDLGGAALRLQGRLVTIVRGPDGLDQSQVVQLSDRERALLAVLMERPGSVHSKRELLRRVWRGAESDEHLVEVTAARLRRRLGPASSVIETVVRRGYRVRLF